MEIKTKNTHFLIKKATMCGCRQGALLLSTLAVKIDSFIHTKCISRQKNVFKAIHVSK